MSRLVVCMDCPDYSKGGYCTHKRKDVSALAPACQYALDMNQKFNPEDKNDTMHDMNTAKTDIPPKTQETKRCNRCGRVLTLDNFYTNKGKPNSICKDCKKKEVLRYRKPKAAKAQDTPPDQKVKTVVVRETMTDQEMVDTLRAKGWTVTCERTITERL